MKRNVKRWGAWIMALVMLCSLVMVPAGNVEAAAVSVDLNPETGNKTATVDAKGNVELRFDVPSEYSTTDKLKAAGINKLEVTFKVTSYSAAGNGTAGAQAFLGHGESWSPGGSWQNLEAGKEITSTLDLSTYLSSSEEIYAYGIQFANLSGSLTYEIVSAKLTGDGNSSSGGTTDPVESEDGQNVDGTSMTLVKGNGANEYYDEWMFTFTNNTGSDVTGVEIIIKTNGKVDVSGQSGISASYDESIGGIRIYYAGTVKNGETLGTDDSRKVGYGKSQGATVQIGYYVRAINTKQTIVTDNDLDIELEYNYAKLLQYSLYFYDANMCGTDVSEQSDLSWRGNCHTGDASVKKTINGKEYTIDVSGGYHDAGDHAKFGLPQAYSASVLGLGYAYFKDAYVGLGQDVHLKKILDRFTDYFEKCTILDESGNVVSFCYQVGEGHTDHDYWGPAEQQDARQGVRCNDVYLTDASTPCTDIVAESAAALAIYAAIYKDEDPTNADTALEYAKKLIAYAESFDNKQASKGSAANDFYAGSSWKDDMALATIWTHKAIGESDTVYLNKYNNYVTGCSTGWLLSWDDVSTAAYLAGGSSQLGNVSSIMNTKKQEDVTPQKFTCVKGEWGSARYNTALQFTGLVYDQMSGSKTYQNWIISQMQYLLGNNNARQCYVIGYNKNDPKHPHHRTASGYDDVNNHANDPMKYTLYGALVGGPDASDTYIDSANKYQYAEVALDYNAAFVGAAAGLYLLNKDDGEQALVTEGLTDVKKYYTASSSTTTSVESVAVTPETTTIEEGKTVSLTASITPKNATNKKVTWSSSDNNVATVSDTGVVTAVKAGTATITVTTDDGGLTATCEATVTKAPPTQAVISGSTAISVVSGTTLKDIIKNYTVTAKNVNITDKGTFSWKKNDQAVAEDTILKVADVGAYTLVFTPADADAYTTAELSVTIKVTKKANTSIPSAPTVAGKTDSSVTLSVYVGEQMVEYGIKQGNEYKWQESPKFENLSPYSDYTFALRYAATDEVEAGAASTSVTTKTYLSDTYMVDLSKLSEDGYVEAHNETITYDPTNKILTLNDNDKTYTLTGDGADITVVSNGAEIILVNANAKSITSTANISVKLEGENVVKEGLASDATIIIDKNENATDGKLTVDAGKGGAIAADTIVIKGGSTKANGTGSVPALKGTKEIDLIGGDLTVDGKEGVVPIQVPDKEDSKIVLDGCQVTSNVDPTYSKAPVDQQEKPVNLCKVVYKVDGEVIDTKQAKQASTIALLSLPIKKGYHPEGWRRVGGDVESVGKAGDEQTVDGDITFEAVYTEITGTLDVTVQQAQDLTTGYVEDGDGVAVKIANNTNVTFDELNLAIDSDAFMLDESKLEQLKSGESRTVIVKLKNGKAAGTYTTQLTVTVSSGEIDSRQEAISRTVQNAVIAVTGINVNLDKNAIELTDDQSATVKATATVLPENATNKQVTWTTGDSKIATVDSNGVVTVLSEGTVDIIATAADGSNITGKATLTVTKKKTEEKPDPGKNPGGSGEVEPGKDPNKPAEEKPNGSGGQNGGSGTGATDNTPAQTPAAPSAADEVKATGIQVTADVKKADNMLVAGTMKLAPKKKMQLNVAFLPEDADEEEVTFTSSNPKVAIVDEDGEITAGKNPGKTTITVKTERGLVKSFRIQVMKKAVTKVKLQVKTKNLKVGKSMKVKATLSPNKKLASNIIYWTSSNEDVVTVTQKGVIKGLKKGKAKITAVAADGSGKKVTVTIKVK